MRLFLATALLFGALCASAQRSPFNGLEVLPADSTGHYRILIGGHFHGTSNNRSGYPAATLLANLDTINKLGANLFLSTGDLFMDAEKDSWRYARAFFSKLKVPFFNAPGNHDSGVVDSLLQIFPLTFFPKLTDGRIGVSDQWRILSGVMLLNTEENNGSVKDGQIELMRTGPIVWNAPHVFIISHRPIWAEDDAQYSDLFKENTRSLTGTNFQKDVYPILQETAKHAHVYWISGSLGGGAPSSIFFQQHAPNITYIQCAIRDEPRDALLIADVYPDTVKWSALSLTGQELMAPEAYNATWWREHVGKEEGFNWRLLPLMIKSTLLRAEFWYGALAALLVAWVVRRFVRRGF